MSGPSDEYGTREVEREPGTIPLLLKAALPAVPGLSRLPGVRRSGSTLPRLALTRRDVAVDRQHVDAYSQVCGFGLRDTVPVTYPHVLAFPLHLAIMTSPDFPFPAVGTIHLANSVTQHRPVSARESLQVTAWPRDLRPHPKGSVFDVATEVRAGGELVWEETSTFLSRGRGEEGAPEPGSDLEVVPGAGIEWRLPSDLGRRYAAVSGDRNPIHLYAVTAKAFGFPRQIAHGMWTKARCLAALEGRLPDAVTVDVAFRKPVLLPGTVAFGARRAAASAADRGTGWAFSLTSPMSGAPHLLGATRAA